MTGEFDGTLVHAIGYANDWREEFYDAVDEQTKLRHGLALSLIPLSATLVYLGINGSSTQLFTGLSVGGAGLYGLSTVMIDSTRDRINIGGALAIGCAVAAVSPLLVTKEEYQGFRNALYGTDSEAGLGERISKVRNLLLAFQQRGLVLDGSVLADADSALALAEQVRERGFGLDGDLSRVAADLIVAVNRIVDEVNLQIAARLPEPQAILSVAQSLGPDAGLFSPVGTYDQSTFAEQFTGGTQGDSPQKGLTESERQQLAGATDELVQTTRRVLRFIEMVDARRAPSSALDACTVDEVSSNFSVAPSNTSVTLAPEESYQMVVRTDAGIPVASLIGHSHNNFDLEIGVAGAAYTVTITAEKAATPGATASLLIAEAVGGRSVTVALVVGGAVVSEDDGADSVAGQPTCDRLAEFQKQQLESASNDFETRFNNTDELKVVQGLLGLPAEQVDGKLGRVTRTALCAWTKGKAGSEYPTAVFTEGLVRLIKAEMTTDSEAAVADTGPQSTLEDAIVADQVLMQAIQEQLGVQQTGAIDVATRDALHARSLSPSVPLADHEPGWPGGLMTQSLLTDLFREAEPPASLKAILEDTNLSAKPRP